MIYITGDTHGNIDFGKLEKLREKKLTYKDILIILGDCGICWSSTDLTKKLELYRSLHCTIIFLDGNHENFDMLESLPIVECYGALMHKVDQHIYHVIRGEIMEINKIKFLCIGGAHSIDIMWRVPGISWWPRENIDIRDINNAKKNLRKFNNEVDFVLTHCVDSPTVTKILKFESDSSTDQLKFIDKIVKYKYWLFGHYHFDFWLNKKKLCMYQEICKIKNGKIIKI
ncbi:MAG: metallophosphoesterase [Bacilli bacterium]|nr:metallophosphoesterase [Bacilli bacterium]